MNYLQSLLVENHITRKKTRQKMKLKIDMGTKDQDVLSKCRTGNVRQTDNSTSL